MDNQKRQGRFILNVQEPKETSEKQSYLRKEGFLLKRGRFGKYRKYWFEVDEINEEVLYYTDNPALGPLKSKLVGNIRVHKAEIMTKMTKNKYEIMLKTPKGHIYKFAADSANSQEEWANAFIKARNFAKSTNEMLETWKKDEDFMRQAHNLLNFIKRGADDLDDDDAEPSATVTESKTSFNDLFSVTVCDVDNVQLTVGEVISGQVTLLVLVRHFGCGLCRQELTQLFQLYERFDALGVRVVVIGNGSPSMAKTLRNELKFPGRIYCDQQRQVYKCLNTRRGLKYLLSRRAQRAYRAAWNAGFYEREPQGDILQLGGAFVLSEQNGLLYQYVSKYAGDVAPHEEVLRALQGYCLVYPSDFWCSLSELSLWESYSVR
jgi:thiol-disulfide isomerase/thioredoxin